MILQKGLKSTVGQTESKASFQNNLYLGEETPRLQVGWMKEESHGFKPWECQWLVLIHPVNLRKTERQLRFKDYSAGERKVNQ